MMVLSSLDVIRSILPWGMLSLRGAHFLICVSMVHPTGWLKVMISPLCVGQEGETGFFVRSRVAESTESEITGADWDLFQRPRGYEVYRTRISLARSFLCYLATFVHKPVHTKMHNDLNEQCIISYKRITATA